MRYLHLQNYLLRILEGHRLNHGRCLTREQWRDLALSNIWINLSHPFLALFNRQKLLREIEKAINPCIPPAERFNLLTPEEKENYYATYNSALDEKGQPILALLEITTKGKHFITFPGYEQACVNHYGGAMSGMAFFTIYTSLFWLIATWSWNNLVEVFALLLA